nr:transporter substrate-binding domain-containing protein [uncultured Devosia sp.]
MKTAIRTIMFGALTAPLLLLGAQAISAQELPAAITIATEGAYAPWNFSNADGTLGGFEVELAADLCARMKVECTVIAQGWDGLIPSLIAGKFDAIMASLLVTDARLETINFSSVYAKDGASFMVASDSPVAAVAAPPGNIDLADPAAAALIEELKPLLKGKIVGVQSATASLAFLQKYFADTIEIREYATTEQHDLDLAAGRIDAIFAQRTAEAATLAKPEYAGFKIAGAGFVGDVFGRGVAAGLRKEDTALKTAFDAAIGAAIADGTVKTLSEKWFGADVTPPAQ